MIELAQDALFWLAGNVETWRQPAIGALILAILGLVYLAHALWTQL